MKIHGIELRALLCEALGLDPNVVHSFAVEVTPEDAAIVTAKVFWTAEANEVLKAHGLPIKEANDA